MRELREWLKQYPDPEWTRTIVTTGPWLLVYAWKAGQEHTEGGMAQEVFSLGDGSCE